MRVWTVGHSNRPIAAFLELLRAERIELVTDVRSLPGSRAHPQFNAEALGAHLGGAGIGYRHMAALGGRRSRGQPDSPNRLWRERAFRNYADYAMGEEFRAGLAELEALAAAQRSAVMCAEAVWWRCHRRIISDYLLARGIEVCHILAEGRTEPARMTDGAQVRPDGSLVYPPPEDSGLPLFA